MHSAPALNIGATFVRGRMGDTRSEHWHFYATDLELVVFFLSPKGAGTRIDQSAPE